MAAGEKKGSGLVGRAVHCGAAGCVEREVLMAAIGVHLGATCACAAVYKVRGPGVNGWFVITFGPLGCCRLMGGVSVCRMAVPTWLPTTPGTGSLLRWLRSRRARR